MSRNKLTLPTEILAKILESEDLSIKEVLNYGSTCRALKDFVNKHHDFWRVKFFQRWPNLRGVYAILERRQRVTDWYQEVKKRYELKKLVQKMLNNMATRCFPQIEVKPDDVKEFHRIWKNATLANHCHPYMLFDELLEMINDYSQDADIRHRYYAKPAYTFTKQAFLKYTWSNTPENKKTLELAATLMAYWAEEGQPILDPLISSTLDDYALQSMILLKSVNPAHPLFATELMQFEAWKTEMPFGNRFTTPDVDQIIKSIGFVMFTQLGFRPTPVNPQDCKDFPHLHKVLETKRGTRRSLWIIFESVARRMGVKCEVVQSLTHSKELFLGWQSKCDEIVDPQMFFSVQRLNDEKFQEKVYLIDNDAPDSFGVLMTDYAIDMVRGSDDLDFESSQLLELVSEHYDSFSKRNKRHYYEKFDPASLKHKLRDQSFDFSPEYLTDFIFGPMKMDVKKRTPIVDYAIGMILRHSPTRLLCVVCGWDIGKLHVWYHVLCEDNMMYFYTEDELRLIAKDEVRVVSNDEIGRYFTKFTGTYYAPNYKLNRIYLEDTKVRAKLLKQQEKMRKIKTV